jgi:hypothetical protein
VTAAIPVVMILLQTGSGAQGSPAGWARTRLFDISIQKTEMAKRVIMDAVRVIIGADFYAKIGT